MILLLLSAGLLARAQPALDAVRPQAISAHVRFLSDDLLEGRYSGSPGHAGTAAGCSASRSGRPTPSPSTAPRCKAVRPFQRR